MTRIWIDLAIANHQARNISILFGNGNGTFQPQIMYKSGTDPISLIVKDLNNAQALDLVVANQEDNSISIFVNSMDRTFPLDRNLRVTDRSSIVVSADFNQDRMLNRYSNNIDIFFGNGDMTFTSNEDLATGIRPSALIVDDFVMRVINEQSNN